MIQSAEREQLKEQIDCRTVAEALLGDPEQCAGKVSHWLCPFHNDQKSPSLAVYADGWRCFGCQAGGDHFDLIMRARHCGFVDAFGWLTSFSGNPARYTPVFAENPKTRKPAKTAERWKEKQDDWRRLLDNAALRLDSTEGERGRSYLEGRGIAPETWSAWRLGFSPSVKRHWKDKAGEWQSENMGPAVALPWIDNSVIYAVQYRLLDHAQRYHQEAGGDRRIFGASMATGRPVLVIVEGELNAVSIWQEAGDMVDVVSFGPESNVDKAKADMQRLAAGYDRVIVWTDKPEVARGADHSIGRADLMLQSPEGLDANDLLQRGLLRDFVAALLGRWPDPRFDNDLAERRYQKLRNAGRLGIAGEAGSFLALETTCGDLHARLIGNPHDSGAAALYDTYAGAWELCRGI